MESKDERIRETGKEQDRSKPCLNYGCGHWYKNNSNRHCRLKATGICKCFLSELKRNPLRKIQKPLKNEPKSDK